MGDVASGGGGGGDRRTSRVVRARAPAQPIALGVAAGTRRVGAGAGAGEHASEGKGRGRWGRASMRAGGCPTTIGTPMTAQGRAARAVGRAAGRRTDRASPRRGGRLLSWGSPGSCHHQHRWAVGEACRRCGRRGKANQQIFFGRIFLVVRRLLGRSSRIGVCGKANGFR